MVFFHNLSIKQKMIASTVLICSIVLILASVFLLTFYYFIYRSNIVEDLTIKAKIVGLNSTSSLLFNYEAAADETLSALKAEPSITAAYIFNEKGKLFARYNKGMADEPPSSWKPGMQRYMFHNDYIGLWEPIISEGTIVGQVYLKAELTKFIQQIQKALIIMLLMIILSIPISYVSSIRFQQIIYKPIMYLVNNMKQVSIKKDYSIRIDNVYRDELKEMISAFNEMLKQIELRDNALENHRNTLENLVAERTSELSQANLYLEQRVRDRTLELETQVTEKEKAMKELAETQNSLVEASRAAGMAEVATGVLHNVGNVLNSVNVSCTLLLDQLRESRILKLSKLTEMLKENMDDLPGFLTSDPRGQKIPQYLISLSASLAEERQVMQQESETLQSCVEHIKEIVAMQQSYGHVSGINETLSAEQLIEDALRINMGGLVRHNISVSRQYEDVPRVVVDKHMALQILLNLISNAKYACSDHNNEDKKITMKILKKGNDHIQIKVEDNGVGIKRDNLDRIFQHGFTTKKTGHGFGLHSAALAAKKLGGSLNAHSDGPGLGAEFTLELPCINGEYL
jgi:two-component system, NtrC family, sensor kinase